MIALNDIDSIRTSTLNPVSIDKIYALMYYNNLYTTLKEQRSFGFVSQKSIRAIQKINSFINLQNNWDSYEALKPSITSINNAIKFIREADKDGLEVYFTAPGRNKDILVEYQITPEISAEIYFNEDGTNELLIFGRNECFVEGTIKDKYYELIKLINDYQ